MNVFFLDVKQKDNIQNNKEIIKRSHPLNDKGKIMNNIYNCSFSCIIIVLPYNFPSYAFFLVIKCYYFGKKIKLFMIVNVHIPHFE